MAYYAGWNKGNNANYRRSRDLGMFYNEEDAVGTVTLSRDKNTLKVDFPYRKYLVEAVKKMRGAKFHPNGKYWTVENLPQYVLRLHELGFSMSSKLLSSRGCE